MDHLYVAIAAISNTKDKKAVISQAESCDDAVNFDTYRILQEHILGLRAVFLPQHGFLLVFVCRLQWIIRQSDKY